MNKNLIVPYPEEDSPVYNKVTKAICFINKRIAWLGYNFEEAEKEYLEYARYHHDATSLDSTNMLLTLQAIMDKAKENLSPCMPVWMNARWGIGVN